MAILDLHLQLFVVAVGEIAADTKDEFIVIERWLCTHGSPRSRPCLAERSKRTATQTIAGQRRIVFGLPAGLG